MTEPLIYTIKGNIPIASLDYSAIWLDAAEFIKLTETYRLEGEIVKESVHVYMKRGLESTIEQGIFG
jgi:hypothetical protein